MIFPQSRNATKGNNRISQNVYVFYSDIPADAPLRDINNFISAFEHYVGSDIWDISVVYDYTAVSPDGSEGATTIKLSTNNNLNDEYTIEVGVPRY